MVLIKGPNGLVFDVAASVASGLIDGGHVEPVGAEVPAPTGEPEKKPEDDEEHSEEQEPEPPAAEESDDSEAEADDEEPDDLDITPKRPAKSASRGVWEDYAVSIGFAEEQLDGLKRDEIVALIDE